MTKPLSYFAPGRTFSSPGPILLVVLVAWVAIERSTPGARFNGQDPAKTGCDIGAGNAEQVDVRDAQGRVVGWVQLRYSGRCQTNWSRVENTTGRADVPLQAYLRDADGNILEATRERLPAIGIYSHMWYAPTGKVKVKACGIIGDAPEACTGPH